jgi:hypothetical protein
MPRRLLLSTQAKFQTILWAVSYAFSLELRNLFGSLRREGIDRAYICEKVYEQDSDEWGVLYHFVSLPISVKISHDD